MMSERWFVVGGVFTDGTFSSIEPGASECHGPYVSETAAELARGVISRRNMDICWHKVWVARVPSGSNQNSA